MIANGAMEKFNDIAQAARPFQLFWITAVTLIIVRLATLVFSNADLGPDEAQYWFWSREPAFGYFSKPPLIAWVIGATTFLFGDSEWAVRLSAPLFHVGSATFIALGTRCISDPRTGAWAGITWLLMPGVMLSSFLITTDAPLLFFWSFCLFMLIKIYQDDKTPVATFALLGAAVGLGLLSKYAMIYFPIAAIVLAILDSHWRAKLLNMKGALAAVITLLLFGPNIIWNAQHDFSTLSHTAANANWRDNFFNLGAGVEFLVGQFAVAGLIPILGLALLAIKERSDVKNVAVPNAKRMLLIFALTPIVIVTVQAFLSRAHANWAATAYPAVVILATYYFASRDKFWVLKANAIIHSAAMMGVCVVLTRPALTDYIGIESTTVEIRGWEEQARRIAAVAEDFETIAIDDRSLMGAMLYYTPSSREKVVALDPNAGVDHHYEAFKAYSPARHDRALFVTTRDDAAHVDYRFRHVTALGADVEKIGDEMRAYHLFEISGYYGNSLTR